MFLEPATVVETTSSILTHPKNFSPLFDLQISEPGPFKRLKTQNMPLVLIYHQHLNDLSSFLYAVGHMWHTAKRSWHEQCDVQLIVAFKGHVAALSCL